MNYRMILTLICHILRLEAVFMVPALAISLFRQETSAAWGLGISMGILLAVSLASLLFPPKKKSFYTREGFVIVALAWVIMSIFGALPFWLSGAIPCYVDCFFETVSGFTTTGASILSDIEAIPQGLLYWRSFTHWLGGMGVLVFLLAVIPMMKNSGNALFLLRAESPGPQVDKLVPRMHNSAKILYAIYVVLTAILIFLLLTGGMSLFDSVTIAFGTAGTGGFSIRNDSVMGYSPYLQNVITVFMALFGINFGIFHLLWLGQVSKALKDEELRFYLLLIFGSIFFIFLDILPFYHYDWQEALHHAAFQVSSIITTTGFSTTDYNLWPQFSRIILTILTIIGGCAGSTGGGIKVIRLLLIGKSAKRDIQKMLRPRSVKLVHLNRVAVDEETIRGLSIYMMVYVMIAALSILLISLDNFPAETTVTAVLTCLSNVGPGLDLVGPMGNFSIFSHFSKLVLSLNMLIGRLEIFPVLILFFPSVWKKTG